MGFQGKQRQQVASKSQSCLRVKCTKEEDPCKGEFSQRCSGDTMYTIKEFCEFAKISERYYHLVRAQGLGPDVIRLGKSIRITKEVGKEWIDKRTKQVA